MNDGKMEAKDTNSKPAITDLLLGVRLGVSDFNDIPEGTENKQIGEILRRDEKKLREFYNLPDNSSLISDPDESIRKMEEMVEGCGVRIGSQEEFEEYIKDNSGLIISSIYLSERKLLLMNTSLKNGSVQEKIEYAFEFKHETVHVLQDKIEKETGVVMSPEKREYQAYLLVNTYMPEIDFSRNQLVLFQRIGFSAGALYTMEGKETPYAMDGSL